MATKTKIKTKTTKSKIKDSLKNVFINELKDSKETERLERVKANADLKEVTIFTHKDQKHCKQFTDSLTQEGIKFTEIDASEGEGLLEQMKTNQFNLFQTIQRLEGRLNPLITFIQNLEKQLNEEEGITTENPTNAIAPVSGGCGGAK